MGLSLTRKVGEVVEVGTVKIRVTKIRAQDVTFSIDAPSEMFIRRGESPLGSPYCPAGKRRIK